MAKELAIIPQGLPALTLFYPLLFPVPSPVGPISLTQVFLYLCWNHLLPQESLLLPSQKELEWASESLLASASLVAMWVVTNLGLWKNFLVSFVLVNSE
jgi:hypothetical protein